MNMSIKDKMIAAVTDYDRRASSRRGYNPYALGIYMQRVDEVCQDIDRGADVRLAVMCGFNDRLLDKVLKALGLEQASEQEHLNAELVYTPSKPEGRQ